MKAPSKIDMAEATRLTREGRLEEAMAVLRGTLNIAQFSAASSHVEGGAELRPAVGGFRSLDMVPPTTGSGGSWTSPKFARIHGASHSPGICQPQSFPALSGLLDNMAQLRPAGGFDGLVRLDSEGIPVVPSGAQFDERSYANEAGRRAYKLYVPSGYRDEPVPLLIMLHGCTQSPDDFAVGTRMNELAEEQIFLVAYPAQSKSANISKCWNWFSAGDQRRDEGEPSLIAGITRQIMYDFQVEPRRVYIAGLSAGGAAAAIMGSAYPDLYAAIGVHSGLACGAASDLSSAFTAMRRGSSLVTTRSRGNCLSELAVPAIVFHGDSDTTVNPVNGEQIIAQFGGVADLHTTISRTDVPEGRSYTRTVHADESGRPMLEHWVLHGSGHAWSGGSAAGSYTDPRGHDVSREMLRFFLKHQL